MSFLIAFYLAVILVTNTFVCQANQIRVPLDYSTISEAIQKSKNGDIIQVSTGVFEETLNIDKPISIIGNHTTISGIGTGTLLSISSNDVYVEGFDFKKAEIAVLIVSSNNCTLTNNTISNTNGRHYAAIGLQDSSGCIIQFNQINESFRGIHLVDSNNNLVGYNIIRVEDFGVRLQNSDLCEIDNNQISGSNIGIQLVSSAENMIKQNLFANCSDRLGGVWIEYSNTINNVFYLNRFEHNQPQVTIGNGATPGQNHWDNGEGIGNYWSDYLGEDTDDDGIGNTLLPHLGVDNYPILDVLPLSEPRTQRIRIWVAITFGMIGIVLLVRKR